MQSKSSAEASLKLSVCFMETESGEHLGMQPQGIYKRVFCRLDILVSVCY